MKKRTRSKQEQAVAVSRVAAAMRLQNRRPQTHQDQSQYNRAKAKRLWRQEPAAPLYYRATHMNHQRSAA